MKNPILQGVRHGAPMQQNFGGGLAKAEYAPTVEGEEQMLEDAGATQHERMQPSGAVRQGQSLPGTSPRPEYAPTDAGEREMLAAADPTGKATEALGAPLSQVGTLGATEETADEASARATKADIKRTHAMAGKAAGASSATEWGQRSPIPQGWKNKHNVEADFHSQNPASPQKPHPSGDPIPFPMKSAIKQMTPDYSTLENRAWTGDFADYSMDSLTTDELVNRHKHLTGLKVGDIKTEGGGKVGMGTITRIGDEVKLIQEELKRRYESESK